MLTFVNCHLNGQLRNNVLNVTALRTQNMTNIEYYYFHAKYF